MVHLMTMRRCIYVGAVAAFASSAIINAAPTEDASVAARDDYSETSYGSFFLEKRGDDDDKDDTTEDLLKGELEPPKRKEWKGKKERRIDWDDVGLKTGGKGDNTPVDPEDPASAVQAKRSLEDFSLETRAPGLSPIVSTAALRDTNLRTAILKNVKDGILWFTADNTQKEIDDADKGFEPKYRAVFENPEGDAVKAFEADHCYPLQFYTASVGAKDNQLYKKAGLSNEKVSGIDKKTWDKWIEVLTGKNKATNKEEAKWHMILRQAINHPNNVDMVLKQANQLYGRVDRYSIKQSLKLQDNKAFVGPDPDYKAYNRIEGGLAAFVRAGNQDRCKDYVEYMGRVSGQIMGNWDKKGAKLLEQQVPELNKVLYKGTLDGTPKGLVATLKEKPDADKKDGLKYEKENMKYTYEEIKKMATDD